ncbi:hypothetical protein B2J93_188 [Marssonina coronariae]|uniref:Uncharacterized protein n=1 Tax=Diplocarpon coronariae TaxID=2795749 RepID=A0A218ZBX2_9HELO|nr:hypothetical protein B2J93_188 [Marssonina coronariae]
MEDPSHEEDEEDEEDEEAEEEEEEEEEALASPGGRGEDVRTPVDTRTRRTDM